MEALLPFVLCLIYANLSLAHVPKERFTFFAVNMFHGRTILRNQVREIYLPSRDIFKDDPKVESSNGWDKDWKTGRGAASL